jgi:hypothetical protein
MHVQRSTRNPSYEKEHKMAPDLVPGSRSKTAWWSSRDGRRRAGRRGGRRSVLIGAGDGRACSPSRWRCTGRRGGGAPAVEVEPHRQRGGGQSPRRGEARAAGRGGAGSGG